MEEPEEKRRIIRKIYNQAETRLRRIFDIPEDEYILSLEYDKPNSRLILKTMKDFNKKEGDI